MLHEKGINWTNLDSKWKNGTLIYWTEMGFKSTDDTIFTEDRNVIEQFLNMG